ncbi:MAG: carboxypeptidase-like regulatory domain-containing protein [Rhodothermales bacterium]
MLPRFRLLLVLAAVLGLAAGSGCGDAARTNPLDPLSDDFRDEGTVSGRVTGLYPPFPGRADIRVRLVPIGAAGRPELATRTDADGQFALGGVPTGPYAVVAEREGFREASDTVAVAPGAAAETTIRLDALPVVTEQSLRTVHIVRWVPDEPVFQLEVEAMADDPDRPEDIDGAALVVPDLGFSAELTRTGDRFTATLGADDLPAPGVEALLGQTLRIEVRDASGNASLGPPMSLVRIIELSPQTLSPQGFVFIETNTPTLVWRPAQLPFAFTYRVDLFLVDAAGIPNLIEAETHRDLDPSVTSVPVTTELEPGDYYWTVWVVDAFGNRSRSREAGFRVP